MTGITAEKINTALGLIDRFENGEQPLAPQDAEQLIKRIFDSSTLDARCSGNAVSAERPAGVDKFKQTVLSPPPSVLTKSKQRANNRHVDPEFRAASSGD